jgi:nucleoside transporter
MRTRLAAVLFLEYAVQGLWSVPLAAFLMGSPHEGGLNMPAGPVALIYATMAVGATLTPLLVGLLCDGLFAVQRMLAVLHFVGAALLAMALWWCVRSQNEVRTAFEEVACKTSASDDDDWPLQGRIQQSQAMRYYLENGGGGLANPPLFGSSVENWLNAIGITTRRTNPYALTVMPDDWRYANDKQRFYSAFVARFQPAIEQVRSDPTVVAAADRAFPPLFALMLAYACVYVPTISLSNVVAFRNLPDPGRQYGPFRALGTLGWIAAGLFVGFAASAVSPLCFLYAAVVSGILAFLCLLLPHTPPLPAPRESRGAKYAKALGLPALKMLGERTFLVYVATAFAATALMPFHNVYTNKFLVDLHIDHPAAVQTLAQPTEILGALAIPWLWWRLGTRWMLTLGLLASAARFFMFATESPPAVIGLGLPLHGIGFALFYIAAALYVDREAPSDLRASAQGLVTVITLGVGGVLGAWFAGQVVEFHTAGGAVAWRPVWLVPALGTLAAAFLFSTLFREENRINHRATEDTEKN